MLHRINWFKASGLCFKCGRCYSKQHRFRCPARTAQCRKCSLTGHWARTCWRKHRRTSQQWPDSSRTSLNTRAPSQTSRRQFYEQGCQTMTEPSPQQQPVPVMAAQAECTETATQTEPDKDSVPQCTGVQTDIVIVCDAARQSSVESCSITMQTEEAS